MSLNLRKLAEVLSFPGIDPRTHITFGSVYPSEDSISVTSDGCFVDVIVLGMPQDEVDQEPGTPQSITYEETARWVFPSVGSGGVVYSRPRPGQKCLLLIPQGDPESGIYAIPFDTSDNPLPQSVIDAPNDLHIISPSAANISISSEANVTVTADKIVAVSDDIHVGSDNLSASTNGVVRKGDSVVATIDSSSAFFTWMELVSQALEVLAHPAQFPVADNVTSTITTSSSTVKAAD